MAERVKDCIAAAAVDAVVVSGDLTQAGRQREFAAVGDYLKGFDAPALAIPGNHDVPVYSLLTRFLAPWARFREHVAPQTDAILDVDGVRMIGLNSARPARFGLDWSLGRLSDRQIRFAAEGLKAKTSPAAGLKVVALHHPVVPTPGPAGGAVIPHRERALQRFAAAGADLVLTGHVHIAGARLIETASGAVINIAAGTAASTRQRGEPPSCNFINWDPDNERLDLRVALFEEAGAISHRQRSFSRRRGAWREKTA